MMMNSSAFECVEGSTHSRTVDRQPEHNGQSPNGITLPKSERRLLSGLHQMVAEPGHILSQQRSSTEAAELS
jgi:hypothetical protein